MNNTFCLEASCVFCDKLPVLLLNDAWPHNLSQTIELNQHNRPYYSSIDNYTLTTLLAKICKFSPKSLSSEFFKEQVLNSVSRCDVKNQCVIHLVNFSFYFRCIFWNIHWSKLNLYHLQRNCGKYWALLICSRMKNHIKR